MSTREAPDPDDPFEYLMETYFDTNSKRTRDAVEDILFDGEVALGPWLDERDLTPREVTTEHAKEYLKDVRENYKPSTQQEIGRRVRFVYKKLLSRGVIGIDSNPFETVLDEHDILEENVPEQSIVYEKEVIQEVLAELHPCYFTMTMVMLKSTRRIGGTVNLDMCDIHIDHPAADWELDSHVRNYPDHIYYSPRPEEDKKFRGEIRPNSSKTETHTIIPMDDELKDTFLWWIMMRRDTTDGGPLFTSPTPSEHGSRVTGGEYRWELETVAEDLGYRWDWHDPDNIRPHYWRHWTTSVMRDKVKKSIVDYFRGDVGNTGDGYDHYTPEKREAWISNIPKFL
jgi:hypothetical protein